MQLQAEKTLTLKNKYEWLKALTWLTSLQFAAELWSHNKFNTDVEQMKVSQSIQIGIKNQFNTDVEQMKKLIIL